MKVIAVITTKDRPEYFRRAMRSIAEQTRTPDEWIVVTDSSPVHQALEASIATEYGAILLQDRYTHNYAGSLNTAMHYILKQNFTFECDYDDTYIAFLDDDDEWAPTYLAECEQALHGEDFVVSGIIYRNEDGERKLSIPKDLSMDSFLKGNPHIQGSNTFLKFFTLLRAGLFDENMSSTTDRDLFTRVMMLNPDYVTIDRYLVCVDAFRARERITTGKQKKADGLRKFYYKYSGFMSEDVKCAFFNRAQNLFEVKQSEIEDVPLLYGTFERTLVADGYHGPLVIGFIATEYELGLRLIKELTALNRANTKLVILINFTQDETPYVAALQTSGYEYVFIHVKDLAGEVKDSELRNGIICDIAVARSALQKQLYNHSKEGDVVWVLDDDMRLVELYADGDKISECPLYIDRVIATYIGKYDAVVGNYCLDAPLPTLSTIRTTLLDYVYRQSASYLNGCTLSSYHDYYYDLSADDARHLETPIFTGEIVNLDDVFSGKGVSRPLFLTDGGMKEARSRGGNTIVFQRELLKILNCSLQIDGLVARRSDYFWVLQGKERGYRIANAPFATMHARKKGTFNYEKEKRKLILDFIGAAFTKAVEEVGMHAGYAHFYEAYLKNFNERLAKCVAGFYRIAGLLSIVKDEKYLPCFTNDAIACFVRDAREYTRYEKVTCAYKDINIRLYIAKEMDDLARIVSETEERFKVPRGSLHVLGNGGEGIAFTDKKYVYKYFFKEDCDFTFLQGKAKDFSACEQLYSLAFFTTGGNPVIRYPFEQSTPYHGGHTEEFVSLLRFCRKKGLVFENIKPENFILVGERVKLVDYGASFLPWTEERWEKFVARIYEMLRYSFLTNLQFKQLVCLTYREGGRYIDSGIENFRRLVDCQFKEDLHDKCVLDIVKQFDVEHVLDYGAGKCKIANQLAGMYDVSVYDIDIKTLTERAKPPVHVYVNEEDIKSGYYDCVLCNLVLCCVPDDIAQTVVQGVNRALKMGGHAVFSICNPLFQRVAKTQLRTNGLQGDYRRSTCYKKHTTIGTPVRDEYHRPMEVYQNWFSRNGFEISSVIEGGGVNAETLMPIAEHLIIVCEKKTQGDVFCDCSLLIKTNPMEWRTIDRNVRHIVNGLERGARFEQRIVVVDTTRTSVRARKYDDDDMHKLIEKLHLMRANGMIDVVLVADQDDTQLRRIYKKYFALSSCDGHSMNGQGLYATLYAFNQIKTRYVLQTDSDILYHTDYRGIEACLTALKKGAVTASLGIAREKSGEPSYGNRTEVRTCFLNLEKLKARLPLPNRVCEGKMELPWHRSLDKVLTGHESVRFAEKEHWFVHPKNEQKREENLLSTVVDRVERGEFPSMQAENVDLLGHRADWIRRTNSEVVLFIRGYNTPCEKIKRLFNSLKRQSYRDFEIVYFDDASTNEGGEYARLILEKDDFFAKRTISCFNDENVGELANFVFAMQNIIVEPQTIMICIDNDDCLIDERAIEIIVEHFHDGAEITCGNCFRFDKPLKRYAVRSFERLWERGGDNIWLHPKCFRRYLFDAVNIERDLKLNGKYIDVNTDFAIMIPMIQKAKKRVFIDEILYYFEPCADNVQRVGKYEKEYKQAVKDKILKLAKEREQ